MVLKGVADIVRNFPRFPIPLIGREEELSELAHLLASPDCRFLTVKGSGGVGKTRLAVEAARNSASLFPDGVIFLSLQHARAGESMPAAMIAACGLPLLGDRKAEEQLIASLDRQRVLFLLDNFEDLLVEDRQAADTPGTTTLLLLLNACPNLKLLITSRQALALEEEWLFPIQGLPWPAEGTNDHAADSVRLFSERSKRLGRILSHTEDLPAAARICRLLEGNPLAIELAAAWTGALSCAEIASEIEKALATTDQSSILTSPYHDSPARHRSMQVVFDHSWKLLSVEEQRAFARLSVFHGGFLRDAAARVAGTSLPLLSALANKSMIWRDAQGRYRLHALVRQFAGEKLRFDPVESASTDQRYCAYFAAFINERFNESDANRQREAVTEIAAEIDNIHAAWRSSIQNRRWEDIRLGVIGFHHFFDILGRYQECIEAMEAAAQAVRREDDRSLDPLLAEIQTLLGWVYIRLGNLTEADRCVHDGLRLYEVSGWQVRPGLGTDPRVPLGILACIEGRYADAVAFGEQALQRSASADEAADPARGVKSNRMVACYTLASACILHGDYTTARVYACQALEMAQDHDHWFSGYLLIQLGEIAQALGDDSSAEIHFQACYEMRKAFADVEGMALAVNHLGEIVLRRGNAEQARLLFQQNLPVYRRIGDRGGLARAMAGLGSAALALGRLDEALENDQQALRIAVDMQFLPLTLSLLAGIGEILLRDGQVERGLQLTSLVAQHPSAGAAERAHAQWLAAQYGESRQIRIGERGSLPGPALLDLAEGETIGFQAALQTRTAGSTPEWTQPGALLEPLTGRELEILRLVAEGRTNQQIGEALFLALSTVKWYTGEIYAKLQAKNRTQAVAKAREMGWIH